MPVALKPESLEFFVSHFERLERGSHRIGDRDAGDDEIRSGEGRDG